MVTQGCKREESNPEIRDPIYQDLLKETTALKAALEETEKKIEAAEKDLAKSQPRTIERKNATNELTKQKNLHQILSEQTEFYQIRTERRRVEGRRAYKIAFDKNETWPDPKEFEAYMTNKKLNLASRNWNERVPKTNHNQIQYDKPKKETEEPPPAH